MNAIFENAQYEKVNIYTWNDLTVHQWECFRLGLNETETELQASGLVLHTSQANNHTLVEMDVTGVSVGISPIIIIQDTEMVVSSVTSKRDYKTDMNKMLPRYERKSSVFNEVLTAYDREFRNVEQQLEITERNILLETSIETLPFFERDLGINTTKKLDLKQRREQIMSMYRASFNQTTEETIKNVASAFSNGDVEVNSTETLGVYEVKFVGSRGIPDNIDGLKKALDVIFPAHLGLTYTFTFNAWEFIKNKIWFDVSSYNWNDLKNEVME